MPISLLAKGGAKRELDYSNEQKSHLPKPADQLVEKSEDCADVPSLAQKETDASLQLNGLDLDAIDRGIVRIRVPLKGGKFGLPGPYADALIKVRNFSMAQLSLGLSKEGGKTVINGAHLTFSPPIKIKNPASAFEPSKGLLSRIVDVDYLKDRMADIILSGIRVTKDGSIHVEGVLKVKIFSKKDLHSVMPSSKLPKVDLSFDALLGKRSEEKSTQAAESPNFDLDKLLKAVGAVVEEARFSVEAHTEPRQIALRALGAQAWTDKASFDAKVRGRARLTRSNSIHINIDKDESAIRSQAGDVQFGGEVRIAGIAKKKPNLESHIAFQMNAHHAHVRLQKLQENGLDVKLADDGTTISGHAFVFRDEDGQIKVKDASSITAKTSGRVIGEHAFKKEDLEAKLQAGHFNGEIRANFSIDEQGPDVSAGEFQADYWAHDLKAEFKGIGFSAPGDYSASVSVPMWTLSPSKPLPNAHGQLDLGMTPSADTFARVPHMRPFQSQLAFDLRDDATLRVDHIRKGVSEFAEPFSEIVLGPKKQAIVPGSGCAPIGTRAFRQRCETLGGSKIRKNNSVELLVDGVASLPKRLALIEGAKKSICLQTLVFKDDDSGNQTVDALCAAAARGVEVRVIIDALGNSSSLMDMVAINPIYSRLVSGGVKLQLHNNSVGEGVRNVLGAIGNSKKIAEHFTLEDLGDPKKLMPLLNMLAKTATGETELDLKEADKKLLVTGLSQVLSGGKSNDALDLVQGLADLTEDGKLDLAEIAGLFQQNAHLNFRWHEKYLIVDQHAAIVGGLNIADEYLLGGTDKKVTVCGKEMPAWRDTDIAIQGDAARDAFMHFASNWKQMTKEELTCDDSHDETPPGDYHVQMVHSSPRIDKDSNILDVMVECLGSLNAGEKAYIESAYFLPTGRTKDFEDALIKAAERGVDVRVLINSETTMDVSQVAQAAVFSSRRLLENGVRIFERTGDKMMHSKAAVFGSKVAAIGSWNADNRSASLNSESMAFVHSQRFGKKVEQMIQADMDKGVAQEIHLEDIAHLPFKTELKNAATAMLSDLL